MLQVLRQGDVVLIRIPSLPGGATPATRVASALALRIPGENGHIHRLPPRAQVAVMERQNFVTLTEPGVVTHEQVEEKATGPTHPPLEIPPGVYEVRQVREYGRQTGGD